MRPVSKLKPGDTIEIEGRTEQIKEKYDPFQDAKKYLIGNLGSYCSYCETIRPLIGDSEVEHIVPKKRHPDFETKWENFLIACGACNNKGAKSEKSIIDDPEYIGAHLPHLNNTFLSFKYEDLGVVKVNEELQGESNEHAKKLFDLVKLGAYGSSATPADNRWKNRMEAWNTANIYLRKYKNDKCDVDTIIDVAQKSYWSVWFTVFKGCDEVRKALIERFPGTAKECFDPGNGYDPVPRNPDNASDPV